METLESTYTRPYVAKEEEDVETGVSTKAAARDHSTAKSAKDAKRRRRKRAELNFC